MSEDTHKKSSNISKIYSSEEVFIDHEKIDKDALFILKRLKQSGYEAYLVGGSVRDLLVNKKPKDFDISTSARPEEIKKLFRNAILIGRRFRLAHIRFGEKIFEVSTFRSGNIDEDQLILRDNQWGTPQEDALRRDFTINALFYDSAKKEVIDYVGGCEDIQKKTLRSIGNPISRFKQDPVRMLRLLKFRARFKFKICPITLTALDKCQEEILKSAPARLLEETLRMLESGASEPFFRLMLKHQFLDILFPWLTHFLQGPSQDNVFKLLKQADTYNKKQIRYNRPTISRNSLFACFIFPILQKELSNRIEQEENLPNLGEITELINDLLEGIVHSSFCHFPKKMRGFLLFILQTQYRFTPLGNKMYKHTKRLVSHPEYKEAMEFLHLRALVDDSLQPIYQSWITNAPPIEHTIIKKKRKKFPRKYNKPRH